MALSTTKAKEASEASKSLDSFKGSRISSSLAAMEKSDTHEITVTIYKKDI
jgi:hypothetical protein